MTLNITIVFATEVSTLLHATVFAPALNLTAHWMVLSFIGMREGFIWQRFCVAAPSSYATLCARSDASPLTFIYCLVVAHVLLRAPSQSR
jgi:hypothetical protein